MMSNTSRVWRRAAWLLVALLSTGCATRQFGPRAVVPAQRGYNEAISSALDQQLLLNLVRLRYRENPLFLEFSSVVAQFNRNASLGASLKLVNGGADESGASAGIGASESPVLTLVPVKGRDFVQRMLAPIQTESLVALLQSGWSIAPAASTWPSKTRPDCISIWIGCPTRSRPNALR
jgi:hypothetical protein